jgi:hypothetical protein
MRNKSGWLISSFLLLLASKAGWCDTFTNRLNLDLPSIGAVNWGTTVNNNMTTIDSNITVPGNGVVVGQCMQYSGNQTFGTSGASCGTTTGVGTPLAIYVGATNISSPTANVIFSTYNPINVTGSGGFKGTFIANATSFIQINSSQTFVNLTVSSNTTLPGAVFYQGQPTQITNAYSGFFANPAGQSIYGNFVGSTTVAAASSATVNFSGYNQYVIKIDALNNVASNETLVLRFNNDANSDYSFSFQGFLIGASTGVFCAHNGATGILLSGINNVENTQSTFQTCTLNLHAVNYGYKKLEGTCSYSETSALDEVNLNIAAEVHQTPVTSLQVFFGVDTGCTTQTDVLTGTTATVEVWGVF